VNVKACFVKYAQILLLEDCNVLVASRQAGMCIALKYNCMKTKLKFIKGKNGLL
jgi:hypothetical protein